MEKYGFGLVCITIVSCLVTFAAKFTGVDGLFVLTSGLVGEILNKFVTSVLIGLALWSFAYLLYFNRLKKAYLIFIYIFTVILTVVNAFCIYNFQLTISPTMFNIMTAVNGVETVSFFRTYVGLGSILFIVFLSLLSVVIWTFSPKCTSYFIEHRKISFSVLFIPTLVSVLLLGGFKGASTRKAIPIVGFYNGFRKFVQQKIQLITLGWKKENKVNLVSISHDSPEYVVFVVGESANRNYMGIYGSKYNTTPLAQQSFVKGNLFVFNDTIACQGSTATAMRPLLSFVDNEHLEENIDEFDPLVDVFSKAGYHTVWLSNQEKFLKAPGFSYSAFSASRCNYSLYLESVDLIDELRTLRSDGLLLSKFDEYFHNLKSSNKRFVVFHLAGSHSPYEQFSKDFNKYSAKDILFEGFSTYQKETIAKYLNTLLYTDWFLNEIGKRLKDKDAVIIYASDHGEELWYPTGSIGHRPTNVTKHMVEIPMMVWVSDIYKAKHPEIIKSLENSQNKPFMTDWLAHTILELSLIKTDQYDASKSVINSSYKSKERKINNISYSDFK